FATSRWEDYFRNQPALQAEVEDVLRGVARRCGPGGIVRLALDGDSPEYVLWVGAPRFAPRGRLRTGGPPPRGSRTLRGRGDPVSRQARLLSRRTRSALKRLMLG